MASSSGAGSSGDGAGGRRYPHNLEGLLRFSAENTSGDNPSGPPNLANIDPESRIPTHPLPGSPPPGVTGAASNDPQLARINQDRALEVLGLHRYRVAGDGNCLFRAVAWQLKLDQEKFHPELRRAAGRWMRENKSQLLEWGLLDGEKEIDETEQLGVWPGQAAIVALANIFRFNIAVIQGGDKGDIDIQHICPFATAAQAEDEQESVILAYLYNGHYDAVVEQPNLENPEFEAWTIRRKQECEADEALARKLATEECCNDSGAAVAPCTVAAQTAAVPDQHAQQHVSEVYVSSHTQPLRDRNLENPLVICSPDTSPRTVASKPGPPVSSKPNRPALSTTTTVTMKAPDKPRRPLPHKSMSEDENQQNDENRIRITWYPKKHVSVDADQSESKRYLYKPALSPREPELQVNRVEPSTNVLHQRQLRDVDYVSTQRKCPTSTGQHPSIRIMPFLYGGQQSAHVSNVVVRTVSGQAARDAGPRVTAQRREYAERGPGHVWTQTSPETYTHADHMERHQQRAPMVPHHSRAYNPLPSMSRYPPPVTSPSDDRPGSTSVHSYVLPRVTAGSRQAPVVVLRARPPGVSHGLPHARVRAVPSPATNGPNKPFDVPPYLRPYSSVIDQQEMDRILRRNFML